MKKIAIITLNGYFNYGNRLQNFALQKHLENQGNKVTTIRFNKNKRFAYGKKIKSRIALIKNEILKPEEYLIEKRREKIFINFSKKYINESEKIYGVDENLNRLNDDYDYFAIGSDQVWNPNMNSGSGAYFANFADKEKKISYSASFGLSDIPQKHQKNYSKYLNDLKAISVREDSGAKIVEKLTGRDAFVLVDPTMLLSEEEWLKVSNETEDMKQKYLLTYFLGGIPKEYLSEINEYARYYNLNVINLGDINDSKRYETGPSEFISYIKNCEIFCTDSFHGCVFSIMFNKPFIAYKRIGGESMYSRIETLLSNFELMNRENSKVNINNLFEIDFSTANNRLRDEQKKSFDFFNMYIN